jgi:STAND-like protein
VNDFCCAVRDARRDLLSVSRELASLKTILEIIAEDAKNPDISFPPTLEEQISRIVANCSDVVGQIQQLLHKYDRDGLRNGVKWVVNGKDDIDKLRVSLEAHKSALELAIELITLYVYCQFPNPL